MTSDSLDARGVAIVLMVKHRYSMSELQACATRELTMRRRIYPNRIMTGRMTRKLADAEIDKMAAIAEALAELAEKERLL